jgi:hypothetical protein
LQDVGFDVTLEKPTKEESEKRTPLYRVSINGEEKDVLSLAELLEAIKDAGRKGATIQRYKGLGEMNPQQLWETTMDPVNRKFLQVKLEPNSSEADDIFTVSDGRQSGTPPPIHRSPRRKALSTVGPNANLLTSMDDPARPSFANEPQTMGPMVF